MFWSQNSWLFKIPRIGFTFDEFPGGWVNFRAKIPTAIRTWFRWWTSEMMWWPSGTSWHQLTISSIISSHLPFATILPVYQDGQMQKKHIDPWVFMILSRSSTFPTCHFLKVSIYNMRFQEDLLHVDTYLNFIDRIELHLITTRVSLAIISWGWCWFHWSVAMSCAQLLLTIPNGDMVEFHRMWLGVMILYDFL